MAAAVLPAVPLAVITGEMCIRDRLEIVIPFDFTDKKDVTVYRYHGGKAAALSTAPSTEEYVELHSEAGFITVHAKGFSTYAIAYVTGDTPEPTPSHKGGGGTTYYTCLLYTSRCV